MKMSELEAHALFCVANKLPLSVLITKPKFSVPEQIIHPFENIPYQMDCYRFTFDENCKHREIGGIEIIAIVDPREQPLLTGAAQTSEELKIGEATCLSPYTSTMLENHVRVEDSYVIDSREKQIVIEGRVDDVMKVLKYIKEGEKID